jgi:hypothetical protein
VSGRRGHATDETLIIKTASDHEMLALSSESRIYRRDPAPSPSISPTGAAAKCTVLCLVEARPEVFGPPRTTYVLAVSNNSKAERGADDAFIV